MAVRRVADRRRVNYHVRGKGSESILSAHCAAAHCAVGPSVVPAAVSDRVSGILVPAWLAASGAPAVGADFQPAVELSVVAVDVSAQAVGAAVPVAVRAFAAVGAAAPPADCGCTGLGDPFGLGWWYRVGLGRDCLRVTGTWPGTRAAGRYGAADWVAPFVEFADSILLEGDLRVKHWSVDQVSVPEQERHGPSFPPERVLCWVEPLLQQPV